MSIEISGENMAAVFMGLRSGWTASAWRIPTILNHRHAKPGGVFHGWKAAFPLNFDWEPILFQITDGDR
jgi:hypothetical protein